MEANLALHTPPCLHGLDPGSCVQCHNVGTRERLERRIKELEAENTELRAQGAGVLQVSLAGLLPHQLFAAMTTTLLPCSHPSAALDLGIGNACKWCFDINSLVAQLQTAQRKMSELQNTTQHQAEALRQYDAMVKPPTMGEGVPDCGSLRCGHSKCAYSPASDQCSWCADRFEQHRFGKMEMLEKQMHCPHPVAARDRPEDQTSYCKWCLEVADAREEPCDLQNCGHPVCAKHDKDSCYSGCAWCDSLREGADEAFRDGKLEERTRCVALAKLRVGQEELVVAMEYEPDL